MTLDDLLSQKPSIRENFVITALNHFECGELTYILTIGTGNICLRRSLFCADGNIRFASTLSLNIENVKYAEINATASMLALTVGTSLSLIQLDRESKLVSLGTHASKITSITHNRAKFGMQNNSAVYERSAYPKFQQLRFPPISRNPTFFTEHPMERIPFKTRPKCPVSNTLNADEEIRRSRMQLSATARRKWDISEQSSALSLSDKSASEILGLQVVNLGLPESHRVIVVTPVAIAVLNEGMSDFGAVFSLQDLNLWNQSRVVSADVSEAKDGGVWILLQSQSRRVALIFWNPSLSTLNMSSKLGKALSHLTNEKSWNRPSLQRGSQSKCGGNQPVTFGHRIKSSGYAPQGKKIIMFRPQTNWNNGNTTFKSSRKKDETKLARFYDTDGPIPSTRNFVGILESMQAPIYGLSYSPSGDRLAVAQGGGLCSVYCTSMLSAKTASKGDFPKPCAILSGHGAAVCDVSWSMDGRLLLTCSLDRTARLWQTSANPKLCGLKLIVSSPRGGCANGLGQPISTLTTAGGVPRKANLVVTAGSDRSLYVLDINTGDFVRRIPSVHASTVTGIAINQGTHCSWTFPSEGSEGVFTGSVETGSYNYTLYATVAPGDSARLWDLRVATRHVAELASSPRPGSAGGHQGVAGGTVRDPAVPPVTLTFSPCGNHLCMGALSNCNPAYMAPLIFDIRKPVVPVPLRSVERQNSANVSLVVAWHPLKSEIATGSIDGRLATFI
nr:unnamed protein product [Spirometra erinaceieuropaei]